EVASDGATIHAVTDKSWDDQGRPVCQAQRMNPASFGEQPGACAFTSPGAQSPDRITHNVYDAAGQLLQVQRAYLTSLQQNYATYEYTPNGKQKAVIDANGNRAEMTYDGYDRQRRWIFPSATATGTANQNDYEEYGYDAVGNRLSLRKRDGIMLTYAYDNTNRMWLKNVPPSASGGAGYAVYYSYDFRGLLTRTWFASGAGITNSYDGFGRLLSSTSNMGGSDRIVASYYDAAGRRVRVDHPEGGWFFTYDYDASGAVTSIKQGGTIPLVNFIYDALGRRTVAGNAYIATSYGYDSAWRTNSIEHNLVGTSGDQSYTLAYNPASQVVARTSSNDAYASNRAYNVTRGYSVNGLNQYTAAGPVSFTYDANGNLTGNDAWSYVYDAENRLVSAAERRSDGTVKTTSLAYDHGPGADEPLICTKCRGCSTRRRWSRRQTGSRKKPITPTKHRGWTRHARSDEARRMGDAAGAGRTAIRVRQALEGISADIEAALRAVGRLRLDPAARAEARPSQGDPQQIGVEPAHDDRLLVRARPRGKLSGDRPPARQRRQRSRLSRPPLRH
ncbi:MAG: hypothetical protein ACJ8DZ_12755, partial [Allosphingosinicella sp.]